MDGFELAKKLEENINSVFVGREEVVENLLVCLLGGGHVLLEDVPGVGKTTLAKTLARSMECSFGRIQFTPDTLPGDVVGVSVYNGKTCEFEYRSGGVMTQILLADEINRTAPKTQASLLEAMAEGQVTVDGETRTLAAPFFVIATQNPVETIGCFPLPEAQLDRFIMKIPMGALSAPEERRMLDRFINAEPLAELDAVCSAEEIQRLQAACREVYVHEELREYLVKLVQATRKNRSGVSPRGTLALLRAVQGYALVQGRTYVVPEDFKEIAHYVLCHRLIGEYDDAQKAAAVTGILSQIEVPTEDWKAKR